MAATQLQILEDGTLIANHPVMEGRGQRRLLEGHRTLPPPVNSTVMRGAAPPPKPPCRTVTPATSPSMTPLACCCRRLLADVGPVLPHATSISLANRPVRHAAPAENRRPRRRDENQAARPSANRMHSPAPARHGPDKDNPPHHLIPKAACPTKTRPANPKTIIRKLAERRDRAHTTLPRTTLRRGGTINILAHNPG